MPFTLIANYLVYWNTFTKRWEKQSLGGDFSNNELMRAVEELVYRFQFNEWNEETKEEMTSVLYKGRYVKVPIMTSDSDPLVDGPKWSQTGGPLHTLNKRCIYSQSFGGVERILYDEYGTSYNTDHFVFQTPKIIRQ
jgi:hypothetical protein